MGDVKAFVTKWCAGHDSGTLGPKIRADLESLLASERAAATAACAEIASEYTDPRELRGAASRECALLAGEIEGRIRALSPEGWVGVRREDAQEMLDVAECMIENETEQWRRDGWCQVIRAAMDRIRAALARGKGE